MSKTPNEIERDETSEAAERAAKEKAEKEKMKKQATEALLGAAGVVTLGMLIKKIVG